MTIAPGVVNLKFGQGTTWQLNLTWNSGGSPSNLVGYSARMQVRTQYDAATAVLSLTESSGITLGGTLGTIAINVGAATTAAIGAASYVYDMELESATGVVTRLIAGYLLVTPRVSR